MLVADRDAGATRFRTDKVFKSGFSARLAGLDAMQRDQGLMLGSRLLHPYQ
jgi:hypothetical protein